MRYRTLRHGASAVALSAGLAATPLAALAEAPPVMTDIPVTHSLVATVMGDLGTPDLLLDRGADPHHFQLRPTQARALSQAGLVVWLGPEMTPWLVRGLDNLAEGEALNLLEVDGVHLQPYQPMRLLGEAADAAEEFGHSHAHGHGHDHSHDHDHGHSHEHGHSHDDDHGHSHDDDHGHSHDDDHGHSHDDDHGHSHDDDHGHSHDDGHGHSHDDDHGHSHDDDHGHGHGDNHGHSHDDDHDHEHGHDHSHDHAHHHGHAHGDFDVHAWMDPANAMLWLDAIAAQLAEMDPDNAEIYLANAEAGRESIDAMARDVAAILEPVQDRGFVVYHDAYGYLATAFGLNILGAIALGDAADPGAARLSAIRASMVESGAVCVFPEVNHPDAYVTLVTGDADLRVGEPLDPAGVMLEPGAGTYEAIMRQMARAIADCLGDG